MNNIYKLQHLSCKKITFNEYYILTGNEFVLDKL